MLFNLGIGHLTQETLGITDTILSKHRKEITGSAVVLLVPHLRLHPVYRWWEIPNYTPQIAANKLPLRVDHTKGRKLVPIQFCPHTAAALHSQHNGNNKISLLILQIKRE